MVTSDGFQNSTFFPFVIQPYEYHFWLYIQVAAENTRKRAAWWFLMEKREENIEYNFFPTTYLFFWENPVRPSIEYTWTWPIPEFLTGHDSIIDRTLFHALSPRGTRLKMYHTLVLDQFLAKRVQTLFVKWNLIGRTLFHVFSRRIFCRTLIHIWSVIDQVQVYLTNFQTRFSRW